MVQMRVDGGCKAENVARAEARIAEAAIHGAQIVLLPEALNLGWTHPSALTHADPIPESETCNRLSEAARRNRVFVCAGLVEKQADLVFNSALLFSADGHIILHHRKINELDIGRQYYQIGQRLAVAKTQLGTFGLIICADAFAPGQVLSRSSALMGAKLILSPCAWAVPADHDNQCDPYGQLWRDNYCPVAKDFGVWIAGASNVGPLTEGPWAGHKCIGCSLLVGPDGQQVLMGPYGEDAEAILYAELTL
jgi:predicted amidohydrolase